MSEHSDESAAQGQESEPELSAEEREELAQQGRLSQIEEEEGGGDAA